MASLLTVSKEFNIPFPGGDIAAKSWGTEDGSPVLALHGWQDNLGTFDRLFPLLPNGLYIVAFDHLGHGLSSHKPHGTFYHYMEMLIDVQRVVDFLKWKSFSMIAHSLGGTLALLYGGVFPDNIISLITLDIIKPTSKPPEELPESTRSAIGKMLRMEAKLKNSAPLYSVEGARKRFLAGAVDELTKEGADALLQRGTKLSECGNGVVFTRDIRMHVVKSLQMFSHDDVKAYLSNLKCHLLIILADKSTVAFSRDPEDILEIYRTNCKSFEVVQVTGDHFVHLNNPETIVPYVTAFFRECEVLKDDL